MTTQSDKARCSFCGATVPVVELAWTGGDEEYACADCDSDEWADAAGVCKHGGPAPCIDDICHALGGCMYYEGGA